MAIPERKDYDGFKFQFAELVILLLSVHHYLYASVWEKMGVDINERLRGECLTCGASQCEDYERPTNPDIHDCNNCGCKPTKHALKKAKRGAMVLDTAENIKKRLQASAIASVGS